MHALTIFPIIRIFAIIIKIRNLFYFLIYYIADPTIPWSKE